MNKKEKILITLEIVFISFNLRAPITAVGSVIEMIQAEYALSGGVAGFITTLFISLRSHNAKKTSELSV